MLVLGACMPAQTRSYSCRGCAVDRDNANTGKYATAVLDVAHKANVPYVDLWSQMQVPRAACWLFACSGVHGLCV